MVVALSLAGDLAVVVAQPERGGVARAVLREPAVVLADIAAPVEAATKPSPERSFEHKQQREKGRSERSYLLPVVAERRHFRPDRVDLGAVGGGGGLPAGVARVRAAARRGGGSLRPHDGKVVRV